MKRRKSKLTLDGIIAQANRSEIATIGTVISQVLQAVKDQNSSAKNLRDIIEVDPPLCAKILKRANSAYYGVSRDIKTIDEAIVLIGFTLAKELALSLKVSNIFKSGIGDPRYSMERLWKHSLAVALCLKYIYRREFRDYGDDAYSLALLHDIGVIVEQQFATEGFSEVLDRIKSDNTSFCGAEKLVFDYTHCDIVGKLMEQWNFNISMLMAVKYHHSPMSVHPDYKKGACALFVADYACHCADLGYDECDDGIEELFGKSLDFLEVKPQAIEVVMEDVKSEIDELEQSGELYI